MFGAGRRQRGHRRPLWHPYALGTVKDGRGQELLAGGNVGVAVRVGDTVRRAAGPWSRSVDAVLAHLEKVGFEGAPRALGYDEEGGQVLSPWRASSQLPTPSGALLRIT